MDKTERLARFLDWVKAEARETGHPENFRRIAQELLDRSGGGRVTESQILALCDLYAGQPGGEAALPLIEAVGELFLEFEDAERTAGSPATAPKSRLGTNLPRRSAPEPPGSPARPTPPPRGAPEPQAPRNLEPPVRPSGAVPIYQPPPVTFTTPGPKPGPATPPAANAGKTPSGQTPVPIPGAPIQSGLSFRCPGCRMMVTATAAGVCPHCGKAPPKLIQAGAEVKTGATRTPVVIVTAVLAIAAGALLAGWLIKYIAETRTAEKVGDGTRSSHLGVEVSFPGGWKRLKREDHTQVQGPATVRTSSYFRGGSSDDPEVALILGTVEGNAFPIDIGEAVSDAEFESILRSGVDGLVRATGQRGVLDPDDCELVTLQSRRTGRCAGTAELHGTRQLIVYMWLMQEKVGLAIFLARGELEDALGETDEIVGSVVPLDEPGESEP